MWREYYPDELQHYGVLGMKWGVRRSAAQLGKMVNRLDRKTKSLKYDKEFFDREANANLSKSIAVRQSNAKYQRKVNKAENKMAKLDRKLDKARKSYSGFGDWQKETKLEQKIAKQQKTLEKNQTRLKEDVWHLKYEEFILRSEQARVKIEKNENLMRVYNQTIDAINKGTIEQGKYFMKYVD